MFKKYGLLLLVFALICSLVLSGCGKSVAEDPQSGEEISEAPQDEAKTEEKKLLAEDFAIAALTCDAEGIKACVYADMQESFVETYSKNEYVFSNVTAEATDEIVMLIDGLEMYTSTLAREYGIKTMLVSASSFTVNFTAEYNGKSYTGSMTIMVGEFEGSTYVISAQIDRMEDAFYEDNCPDGDFYFDMHGEE